MCKSHVSSLDSGQWAVETARLQDVCWEGSAFGSHNKPYVALGFSLVRFWIGKKKRNMDLSNLHVCIQCILRVSS